MKTAYIFAAFIAVGFVIATIATATSTVQPWQPPADGTSTISVVGDASMEFEPTELELFFTVETTASTAEKAQENNARAMADVKAELIRAGIHSSDMETTGFNVYPTYNWANGKQELTGYTASHGLKVWTDNLSASGKLLDAAVSAGANRVDYIRFKLDKEDEQRYRNKLMAEASENAREKADAIAEGLGNRVVGVRSVNENNYNYQPWMYKDVMFAGVMEGATMMYKPTTDISPRDVSLNAQVSVVFEIA